MIKPSAVFLWRKVDHPGHDSCRLFKLANGWRLSGAAIFWDNGKPCHLLYAIWTDKAWRTKNTKVSGYIGKRTVDIRITSALSGGWRVNGVLSARVTGCLDVDLGFTPATNLTVLRRLALKIGQRADAPAAYLQFPELRLVKLPQSYQRIGRTEYEYDAPTVGYSGKLKVSSIGAVKQYPGLFELVMSG
jgi:uncharacterized protein